MDLLLIILLDFFSFSVSEVFEILSSKFLAFAFLNLQIFDLFSF